MRWFALALSICLAMACATACVSAAGSSTPDQIQAPAQAQSHSPAQSSTGTAAAAAADPASGARICGVPPCDRYLSRGDTRTLDSAISKHPIASAIALHVAVGLLCGAVLCVWGEGFTLAYVQHAAHQAAQNGDCLRVHILPQGREWRLVQLDGTNQSPYCTD
jgi:hypothetical protein